MNYLEFRASRAAECDGDTVHVALNNLRDLSEQATVIQLDLGLEGTVYPAQFLGIPIAFLAISNGEQRVELAEIPHDATDETCGLTATIPSALSRAIWRIQVDGVTHQAHLFVDEVEHSNSPVDLAELLPPWRVEIGILGGDLVGGCGGTAAILLFGYEVVCQW